MNNQNQSIMTKQQPMPKSKQSKHVLVWLIILLFAFFVALVIGISYRFMKAQDQIIIAINTLSMQQSKLNKQININSDQLSEQNKLVLDNQKAIERIQNFVTHDMGQWQCQKIEYLIRMANLTLQLQRDIPLAINLLKSAREQLRELPGNKFLNIEKLLSHDISRLNKLLHINDEEVYIRLQQLNADVEKLQLMTNKAESDKQSQSEVKDKEERSIWMRGLMASWDAISKVLVIHHRDEDIEPLISPEQRNFLNLNLHVLFAQAQWSMLRHQDKVYLISLKQIKKLVGNYFMPSDEKTKSMLKTLSDLEDKARLMSQLPNINQTLQMLKTIDCSVLDRTRNNEALNLDTTERD